MCSNLPLFQAEEIKYNTVLNDYRNTLAYKNQMEDLLNSAETTLEEERSKLEKEGMIVTLHKSFYFNQSL